MYSEELLLSAKKLRFPPNVEAAFIADHNIATLVALQRVWLVIVGLILLTILSDILFFEHYRWEFAAIRLAMIVPTLVAIIRSRQISPHSGIRIHVSWYIVATSLIFNIFQWFVSPADSAYTNYGLTNVVFIAGCATLSRGSFRQGLVGAILVIFAYNANAILAQYLPHPAEYRMILLGTNLRFLLILIVVAVIGYMLESMKRQDFAKSTLLEQERKQVTQQNTEILRQQEILESSARDVELANASLQSLNNELHRVNGELRTANTFKTQMLSMASHDLKNPLAGITGLAEALLDNEQLDEQQIHFIEQIQRSSKQMIGLIQNVLDSAAIELGSITLRKNLVNASSVWSEVHETLYHNALVKEQTIVALFPSNCILSADPERLHQVFENLLSNAIKYSPKGSQIDVTLKNCILVNDREYLHFSVHDHGPGISEGDRVKMFGMFQKLSAEPTGGETSHGVGLAIVKQIVDAHGGHIIVKSTLGEGTTFIVELPLSGEE